MPPVLDAETKELLGQFRSFVSEMPKIKDAVGQLEEQVKGMPQTLEAKLAGIRQAMSCIAPRGNIAA